MHICVLDGERITDREMLHAELAVSLNLPPWYGRNLDALYDCLTDMREDVEIRIVNREILEENLGKYALSLLQVIDRASAENSWINCEIEE